MTFNDVLEIKNGRNQKAVENPDGRYPIYGSGGIIGHSDDYICEAGTVIVGRKGSINNPIFVGEPFWNVDTAFGLTAKKDVLLPRYLYYFCMHFDFERLNKAVTIPSLTKSDLLKIEILLPDLNEQQNVVDKLQEVERIMLLHQEAITKLDEIIKARFVEMFGDPDTNSKRWPERLLSEMLDVLGGYAFKSDGFSEVDGIPVLRIGNINAGFFKPVNMVFWKEDRNLERYIMHPGDLVMSLTGTVGKDDYGNVCILGNDYSKYYLNQRNAKLELKEGLNKYYLSQLLRLEKIKKRLTGISRGVRQANISNRDILGLKVPIPSIELQQQFSSFVAQVDKSKLAC